MLEPLPFAANAAHPANNSRKPGSTPGRCHLGDLWCVSGVSPVRSCGLSWLVISDTTPSVQREAMANQGTIISTKGIVCQNCGDMHVPIRQSWQMRSAGPGELWCSRCGNLVQFVTHLSWETLDTRKETS